MKSNFLKDRRKDNENHIFMHGKFCKESNADYIITLCEDAKDNCPYVGAKTKNFHWDLLDPANAEGREDD